MSWETPSALLLQIHIAVSIIGILSGLVVLFGLMTAKALRGWTAAFLGASVLTSVTGFPLPPFGFDPPRAVGVISLVLLAVAVAAYYVFRLSHAWRLLYVGAATIALYLNVFVAVTQAFEKLPVLRSLAPTQSEPPFVVAQLAVLVVFIVLIVIAAVRFHPETT